MIDYCILLDIKDGGNLKLHGDPSVLSDPIGLDFFDSILHCAAQMPDAQRLQISAKTCSSGSIGGTGSGLRERA